MIQNDKVQSVVVLGSKPSAVLPNKTVPVVLAANGAIELAVRYRVEFGSYLIGLVPLRELQLHQHICDSFMKAEPDEIVIMGGEPKESEQFVREHLKLQDVKVTTLSLHQVNWDLAKYLGFSRFRIAFSFIFHRGLKYFITHLIPDLLKNRECVWMHRSTGLSSILYAVARFPNVTQIIIGGINFTAGGHFNGVGQFTSKTAFADRVTIAGWPEEKKNIILTTEEDAKAISGFKIWTGETF